MDKVLLEKLIESLEELNANIEMFNREVFTARQAAKYSGIGYDTILRLARIGEIECVKNGTNYLFKREYLDRWLEKNKKGVI